MTKTVQQIRQAIRELHIDIEPHNVALIIEPDTDKPGTYKITGKNRKGDPLELSVNMDTNYPILLAQLKAAWQGKDKTEDPNT